MVNRMKKKIRDLTLGEIAKICYANTDSFGNCDKHCPLKNNCGVTKHIRIITYTKEALDKEIEVDE